MLQFLNTQENSNIQKTNNMTVFRNGGSKKCKILETSTFGLALKGSTWSV
jgi:hypothetical protein